MIKEILMFDNIEIEKKKIVKIKNSPSCKSYFFGDVNIEKVLMSHKFFFGETKSIVHYWLLVYW